jgi:hypothetical protein
MRINKSDKENLCAEILSKMFNEDFAKIKSEKAEIGNVIIDSLVDLELLSKAPEGYFPYMKRCYFYLGGNTTLNVEFQSSRKAPYSMIYYMDSGKIGEDQLSKAQIKKLFDLNVKEEALTAKRRETKDQVNSILASVNTYKQLKELWPDLFKYISCPELKEASKTSVAPLVSNLNKLLTSNKS